MAGHPSPPGGNIYEDLGFPPGEARNLKIRSMLMLTAGRFIEERGLTQVEAAQLMGVSQPRISDLVRGRIRQFTIDSLINMLTNAGVRVEVRAAGKVA